MTLTLLCHSIFICDKLFNRGYGTHAITFISGKYVLRLSLVLNVNEIFYEKLFITVL